MTTRQGMMLAAGFVVPPLCCLIAVSALANLVHGDTPDRRPDGMPPVTTPQAKSGREGSDEPMPRAQDQDPVEVMATLDRRIQELQRTLEWLRMRMALLQDEPVSSEEISRKLEDAKRQRDLLIAQLQALEKEKEIDSKVVSVTRLSGKQVSSPGAVLFIECVADGVILQPQQERFARHPDVDVKTAFRSSLEPVQHVVFLVRPDGFESFWRYHALVTEANEAGQATTQIGYEPVDQDWRLTYPSQKGERYAGRGF